MIILISGATHTGKTRISRLLIQKTGFSCLSLDHLKMGLIRSGKTSLTPENDDKLTEYMWPVVREMIKTAIENGQDMIIEGCYIPFDFKKDFSEDYLRHISYLCLVMSEAYIESNFDGIRTHASDAEQRRDESGLTKELLKEDNSRNLALCKKFGCKYTLIESDYEKATEEAVMRLAERDTSFSI